MNAQETWHNDQTLTLLVATPIFDGSMEADAYQKIHGGTVYTRCTEGPENYLSKGFHLVNRIDYVVLPFTDGPDQIDQPSDEPEETDRHHCEMCEKPTPHDRLAPCRCCCKTCCRDKCEQRIKGDPDRICEQDWDQPEATADRAATVSDADPGL